METHKPKTANINDFREWDKRGELILAPKFQRRKVWKPKAKSYLIDTILNGFPIPAIYIRQTIDLNTHKTIREVIDGQQRISTILDYIYNKFTVLKVHNKKYGDLKYADLPDDVKSKFLEYDLSVDYLIGANDSDVLEVFDRINSYTVILNKLERLNAAFSGKFKQAVFKLGRDHLEFWRKNNILSDYEIMRMKEAELCTDIVIAMIDGIQDRKKIKTYYTKYDDEFKDEELIVNRFKKCIDKIVEIFGDILIGSSFRKTTLFYSLFCAIYDLLYGLKGNYGTPKIKITNEMIKPIRKAISHLEKVLTAQDVSKEYLAFVNASSLHTTDQKNRITRHEIIIKEIIKELEI